MKYYIKTTSGYGKINSVECCVDSIEEAKEELKSIVNNYAIQLDYIKIYKLVELEIYGF